MMQKVRNRTLPCGHSAFPACRYTISGSLNSPHRGSFHLSLTVLVHYRSISSIQAYEMVLADSGRIARVPPYLGFPLRSGENFGYGALTLYGLIFHSARLSSPVPMSRPRYPNTVSCGGLACSAFARHYSRNRVFFLFLPVLRCFTSRGLLVRSYLFRAPFGSITCRGFPHSDISGS